MGKSLSLLSLYLGSQAEARGSYALCYRRSLKRLLLCLTLAGAAGSWAAEGTSLPSSSLPSISAEYKQALLRVHRAVLEDLARHPDLQKALKAAAQSKYSLADVLRRDALWNRDTDLQHSVTQSRLANRMQSLTKSKRLSFAELMLTNTFGELVAAYPLTSDYWQGDELKFIQPMLTADVYTSEVSWDESSEAYSFFVCLPIFSKSAAADQREVIGVLIAGLDVSREYLLEMTLGELMGVDVTHVD